MKANPPYDLAEICDRLTNGDTLQNMARERGVGVPAMWEWLNHPSRKDAYREALRARGVLHAMQTEQYVSDMLNQKIDPKAADIAIRASQWMASKLVPELFGDRRDTTITVNDEQTKHLQAVKARMVKRIEDSKNKGEDGGGTEKSGADSK